MNVEWWKAENFTPPGNWTVHRLGGASKPEGKDWRTCRWDTGATGLPAVSGLYQRWLSGQTFTPPYRFEFEVNVNARPDTVWIESENRAPTWWWGVCFYPWASPTDPWRDNVVTVLERPTTTPVATQQDRNYSTNWDIGNYQRFVFPRQQWTKITVDVRSPSEFTMWSNDRLIVRAKERSPTFRGPGRVGFRVDFYDLAIRNPQVFSNEPEPVETMYQPVAPRRILDTRAGKKPRPGETLTLNAGRSCKAVHANITVVDSSGPGWLAAWADGAMPNASILNTFARGQTVANAVNIPTTSSGEFRLHTSAGDNLIVDVLGYYP